MNRQQLVYPSNGCDQATVGVRNYVCGPPLAEPDSVSRPLKL